MADPNSPKIVVRMYKTGTGDFFLLRIDKMDGKKFNILLDCGSYKFDKTRLDEIIDDMHALTDGIIDLLIVTHEHEDHISGFETAKDKFSKLITFKNVWFAWTEDKDDPFANDLREHHSKIRLAIYNAYEKVSKLMDNENLRTLYQGERNYADIKHLKETFISSMDWLNSLNYVTPPAHQIAGTTMVDKFRSWGIIKDDTVVEFREPGEIYNGFSEIEGIRFLILGPPKNLKDLFDEGKTDDYYKKREKPSGFNFEFIDALVNDKEGTAISYPFETDYIVTDFQKYMEKYTNQEKWRSIESDWLLNVGNLAIRLERCLNNTSLAFALQLKSNEHVLLFTGDAEYGNWSSWYNKLFWDIQTNGITSQRDINYLLKNTVFYKVGHHLSQNGTPKEKGIDLMTSPVFAAMVSLDLDIIHPKWRNTMPCDYLGAALIEKTKGNIYFSGDHNKIINNIQTARVNISRKNIDQINSVCKPFLDKNFVEVEIN